jgi:hypothetical protein
MALDRRAPLDNLMAMVTLDKRDAQPFARTVAVPRVEAIGP